jgi:acetylornithine deacetylase/succinyl-diaminopimelate desuccinylase family protein
MKWLAMLEEWFDSRGQEGLDLCAELVRQNTVNPPGNEYLAARVVEEYLQRYGISSNTYEGAPGRTNLLAPVGSGSPVVFVPAHTDVVPAGDGWEQDPFEMTVRDGYIYGRGVNDDKGPLVSLLLLAAFLSQHTDEFNGTLLVGAVADEEIGSELGLTYLLENNLVSADYAIVPDTGSSIYKISCGEKGLLHCDIVFSGRQAHGSTPEKGLNALWAAHAFLDKIRSLFGDIMGYCREDEHELFSPTTINAASIHAGSAVNIVPGECTLGIDIRYVPPRTSQDVISMLETMAREVQDAGLCDACKLNVQTQMDPFEIDADNPVVQALNASVTALSATQPERMGMSGTTVCKQLLAHGIPAIGFSQDAEDTAHMAGERLAISELVLFGKALGLAFLKLGNNW